MANCLEHVRRDDAASIQLLDSPVRAKLRTAVEASRFRRARAVVGTGDKAVTQDFEICDRVDGAGLIGRYVAASEALVNSGLERLTPTPCPPVEFNDLVAQRYPPVACGISPHRDHIRYVNLVAILVIAGAGRFFVCDDRAGTNAREIPAPEGSLLLMRAPGFDGSRHRPFHMLGKVTRERLILGLRQDARKQPETP
ncbi:hypothetical protein [Ferruginivarius sediminum]|uniref:Fe2OG dioxygenase domain-containing protein n=1 Tax=Ferruginivarius sediminum TaxID=2661937 RepID=A0A369T5U0_9PROT|nr:hypothetical protein [Ferruginivarius sediminum]RDD60683.1 hypothetical protein DRB17_16595 [Ferruginivarius sediminum]